jgi:carbon storage regulator
MLVLSRKRDESIVIGDGVNVIEVTVVDIRGDKIRLGITAPENVPVHRREIYDMIHPPPSEPCAAAAPETPPAETSDPIQSECPAGGTNGALPQAL